MPTSLPAPCIVASFCMTVALALCAREAAADPAATRIQRQAKTQPTLREIQRETQREKEAREDGFPAAFGIVLGPLVGTRIGEPIGGVHSSEPQGPQTKDIEEQQGAVQPSQREFEPIEKSKQGKAVDRSDGWRVGDDGRGDVGEFRKEAASVQKASEQVETPQGSTDAPMRDSQDAQAPTTSSPSGMKPCQPAPDCGAARTSPR